LSAAVQNTLGEYLKGTKIELVSLEAKLAGSIASEAKTKECDYVLYVTVSHKKGGGGGLGGMFGSVIAPAIGSVGLGNTGSVAGNIAAQAAANAIITAGTVAANVKSKDEITLDVKLDQAIGVGVFAKQYKNKAKSNGQDIISPLVEQMAQTVVESAK
jgi:outer membrane lipoprotein SlyB